LNKIQFVIAFISEQNDEMLMLSARKEEKKKREVPYFILSFTASFFSRLDIRYKNEKEKKKEIFFRMFHKTYCQLTIEEKNEISCYTYFS